MPTTRRVNISLVEQAQQERKLYFIPVLTSLDGDLLLEEQYHVTTDENGDATIDLPVKGSGNIRYDYEVPSSEGGTTTGYFLLEAGEEITLDDLLEAGGEATDSLKQYVDRQLAGIGSDMVHLTGDEEIDGVKTFNASPLVPAPTEDLQPATKQYVDEVLATLDGAAAHKSGDEEIAGIKTFTESPVIPAPSEDLQAATKKYVDDAASAGSSSYGSYHFRRWVTDLSYLHGLTNPGDPGPESGGHVNIGSLFGEQEEIGKYRIEAICRDDSKADYVFAHGYGPYHLILFGARGGTSTSIVGGNMYDADTDGNFDYNGCDQIPLLDWHHKFAQWDGDALIAGIDGLVSAYVPFTGRPKLPATSGGNCSFWGGSDHSGYNGWLSVGRIIAGTASRDGSDVRTFSGNVPTTVPYRPELKMRGSYNLGGHPPTRVYVTHGLDFSVRQGVLHDFGSGRNGGLHPGVAEREYDGEGGNIPAVFKTWDDPFVPYFDAGVVPTKPTSVPAQIALPGGAKVYEDWSKANQTLLFDHFMNMGSTRSDASLGPIAWSADPTTNEVWAILFGRAAHYGLGPDILPLAANAGLNTATMHITFTKPPDKWCTSGVVYRYKDANNYGKMWVQCRAGGDFQAVYCQEVVGGSVVTTHLDNYPIATSIVSFEVICSGTSITVKAGGAVVEGVKTSSNLSDGYRAGLFVPNSSSSFFWGNETFLIT